MKFSSIPTPKKLYIYDDFEENVKNSLINNLKKEILKNKHVILLKVPDLISELCEINHAKPYSLALALSQNGENVAKFINRKTKIFPAVQTVGITRMELTGGRYSIESTYTNSIPDQFSLLSNTNIAIVDDTIYSGQTLYAVLKEINTSTKRKIHIYSLLALKKALNKLPPNVSVFSARILEGNLDEDVSIIRGSGLFTEGAIRQKGKRPMAFCDRPDWIRSWFPRNSVDILCLSQMIYNSLPSNFTREYLYT